jgi:hypothetical protein
MIVEGIFEGDVCNREGCNGIINTHPVRGCSCHINPPCSACTEPRNFCSDCGWEEREEESENKEVVTKPTPMIFERKPLDPTRIDWYSKGHTHFSILKIGVYPEDTDIREVEKVVRGSFGGRFKSFGNGKFEYVAYTD